MFDFRNMHFIATHEKSNSLIEITIIQKTIPGYGQNIAAHKPLDRARIERIRQLMHILLQITGLDQPVTKSAQRDIGPICLATLCGIAFQSFPVTGAKKRRKDSPPG